MKKPSKRAQIYLDAAERIASGRDEFSCNAVIAGPSWKEARSYSRIMAGTNHSALLITDIEEAVGDSSRSQAAIDFRVLLLCTMAAACDDLPTDEA